MTTPGNSAYSLAELAKEQTLGGVGAPKARDVPRIDMSGFAARKAEIAEQVWKASTEIGFFQLVNHGIAQEQVDEAFAFAERFFALPRETKARYPLGNGTNAGWEYKSQVRPSTGTPDQKESYQITLPRMAGLWPMGDELPGFKAAMLAFERANWALGMKALACFALKLGFHEDFFTERHDPLSSEYQSTLRLLHYMPMANAKPEDFSGWRAGAHTDFDCLTLLHQRSGHGGLQLCPGKESAELAWTDVEPLPGVVTCNIGDMLMRWSDDKLLSTLHRVRRPPPRSLDRHASLAMTVHAMGRRARISSPQGAAPASAHFPPIARDVALRVDRHNDLSGDRARTDAAPIVNRVVARGGHRNGVRAGILSAIGGRPRQRPARVRLAAIEIGADPAGHQLRPDAAHESRVVERVDADVESLGHSRGEFRRNLLRDPMARPVWAIPGGEGRLFERYDRAAAQKHKEQAGADLGRAHERVSKSLLIGQVANCGADLPNARSDPMDLRAFIGRWPSVRLAPKAALEDAVVSPPTSSFGKSEYHVRYPLGFPVTCRQASPLARIPR